MIVIRRGTDRTASWLRPFRSDPARCGAPAAGLTTAVCLAQEQPVPTLTRDWHAQSMAFTCFWDDGGMRRTALDRLGARPAGFAR